MLCLPVPFRFWFIFVLPLLSINCSVMLARVVLALRPRRPLGYPDAAAVAEQTLILLTVRNSNDSKTSTISTFFYLKLFLDLINNPFCRKLENIQYYSKHSGHFNSVVT